MLCNLIGTMDGEGKRFFKKRLSTLRTPFQIKTHKKIESCHSPHFPNMWDKKDELKNLLQNRIL
jgi:hypothetical protein